MPFGNSSLPSAIVNVTLPSAFTASNCIVSYVPFASPVGREGVVIARPVISFGSPTFKVAILLAVFPSASVTIISTSYIPSLLAGTVPGI